MGCHTWTYKRCASLPQKQKEDIAKNELQLLEEWWGFHTSFEEFEKFCAGLQEKNGAGKGKTPREYAEEILGRQRKRLDAVRERGFDALLEYGFLSENIRKVGEEYYIDIDFDKPLRVFGYPEECFTDMDKLLEWLQTLPSDMFGYYKWDEDDMYHFKEGYSNELVSRIKTYFEKNGKDDLYIEFG